ncbi:hypothetical protein QQX09_08910 [Demequina sp. SYSU T00192]|uniref:Uncharacterized protein n=1 Tax=Demequina litoralis TaxID=3051660 RepID=A0ABT8GA08_9MICO|nr:hypothetical protein [Demequina sp. SYSU T00192]MDN4475973.1 hypothetical protein [Demequina sp. SYSU T00192]
MKKILATLFAVIALTFAGASAASATDPCATSCGGPYVQEETGWGSGTPFDGENWSMYSYGCNCAQLIAGNPKNDYKNGSSAVGNISFSRLSNGTTTITIKLFAAKFVDDPVVHIAWFNSDFSAFVNKSGNPVPGNFPFNSDRMPYPSGVDIVWSADGRTATITGLPQTTYYAIHTEVLTVAD